MAYDEEALVRDLKALMKHKKRSARSISQAIGVPYRSMQNYLSGESRIPAIVLIKMLDELGATVRMLRFGDDLLSHSDMFDAVYRVFGDFLNQIDLKEIGKRRAATISRLSTPEELEAHGRRGEIASELAVRLSEAYDEFSRSNRLPIGPFPTIKEIRQRAELRARATSKPDDEIGQ